MPIEELERPLPRECRRLWIFLKADCVDDRVFTGEGVSSTGSQWHRAHKPLH